MFESHITVEPNGLPRENFIQKCTNIGAKPVIIEQDTGVEFGVSQWMTAKFHKSESLEEVIAEVNSMCNTFSANAITRRKIEWIGSRRANANNTTVKYDYVELHTKFLVDKQIKDGFAKTVLDAGSHCSINQLKQPIENDCLFLFVTSRSFAGHQRTIKSLEQLAEKNILQRLNTIREFVVYDDNPGIDTGWMSVVNCFECPLGKLKEIEVDNV